jgi:hypothetical protein
MHTEPGWDYFFSDINKIVDFLNEREQRHGLLWQTVVAIQVDTNKRQPVYIMGHEKPCNTFSINRFGQTKPLNVHKVSNPS